VQQENKGTTTSQEQKQVQTKNRNKNNTFQSDTPAGRRIGATLQIGHDWTIDFLVKKFDSF